MEAAFRQLWRKFQSTLSVRRATRRGRCRRISSVFQSTLSVRRATGLVVGAFVGDGISIHALRKESDYVTRGHIGVANISIHALRKESDNLCANCEDVYNYFNPRSP